MTLTDLLHLAGPYATLLETAIVILVGLGVYAAVGRITRRVKEPKTRVTLSRVTGSLIAFLVLVAILALWVHDSAVFLVVAGLISAGVAFSLQGPLTSLVAWLAILFVKPFEVGDRVQSGEVAGDVVSFNPFFFQLLEIGQWSEGDLYTGRLVEVPNNQIMTQPLRNYSRNFLFLWDTVVVGIYYEADWEKARSIALAVAARASETALAQAHQDLARFRERYFMPRGRLEPQVFLSLAATTINLSVRYVTDVWRRSWTRSAVVEGILREYGAAGIDIAYPSVVLRPATPGPGTPAPAVPDPNRA